MPSFRSSLLALVFILVSSTAAFNKDNTKKTLNITWEIHNANGNPRYTILVNGQFPAPALIFDEGDYVEVTVHNEMPFNTTIHWHGMLMMGTPWSDGVPGLTQKPIEPGESFIYRFTAEPPGTYWYHAHSRAILLDGLYGPLFVRPKPENPKPWSLISNKSDDIRAIARAANHPHFITVSDWTNFTSWEYMAVQEASELDIFCVDSILVNGIGSVYCPPTEELISLLNPKLAAAMAPDTINDKGCFPFDPATEDQYLPGKPQLIPPGFWSGCVPTTGPAYPVFEVDACDKWASMNLVMASTMRIGVFSIDNHYMWVYEIDGQYIEPQLTQALEIFPGQRYGIMVKLDQTPQNYTIRMADRGIAQLMSGYGVLQYKNGKETNITIGYVEPKDQTQGWISYGGSFLNNRTDVNMLNGDPHTLTPPFPANPPSPKGDDMFIISMGRWGSAWQWTQTGRGLYPQDAYAYTPLLYAPNSSAAMDPNLVIRTTNGSWVDIVLQVGALPGEPLEIAHALHKHSSRVWVIGAGFGIWNYSSVAEGIATEPQSFNLVNPNYRDTIITPYIPGLSGGWVVIRYQVTNPGPWMFHCHVETHLAGGMAMVIMDGVDKWPTIPPEYGIDQMGHPKV